MSVHSSHASSPRRARWSEGAGRRLRRALATLVAAAIAVLGLGVTTPAAADELTFVSTWEPANTSTGSSNSNQVRLPLTSTGTYDFSVDWGDGTVEQITEYDQPEVTHTYATEDSRTITITGTIDGFRFDNVGDRLKITDISSWGPLALGNSGGYFHGAENLTISATDSPELADTTNLSNAFLGATSLTGDFSQWDVSGVTNMRSMFEGATAFNTDLGMWDVASVVTMRSMFQDAAAFDADLSEWTTAAVTSMRSMFDGATSFDRDLGSWDVSNVADMSDMFAGGEDVGLSLDNYSSLLQGWAALPVQPGVDFNAGESYYNPTTSQDAHDVLTDDNSWTITDAGAAGVPNWPAAPAPVAASGSESATVTWDAPNSNHSAITEYTVTAQPGGQTCTVAAPTLTCDVAGLSNGTGYRFSVTATNAVGTSAASPLSNSITPQTTEPSTPAKPVAAALNESATVWVSRGSGGGVPDSYEVTASPGGATCSVTVPANSCSITGLTNGTPYTFTATATNVDGSSAASPASDSITPAQPLAMTWDTTKTSDGSTGNTRIRLPLVSDGNYNFTVSWGDGTVSEVTSGIDSDREHNYSSAGVKNVTITGTIWGWSFSTYDWCVPTGWGQSGDRNKLTEISSWGPLRLDSATEDSNYFCNAENLTVTATDTPDLTSTTSLEGAFQGARTLNSSLDHWDVSGVTDMTNMFYSASSYNQAMPSWDTGNVTSMQGMFQSATSFNQPLPWTVSSVTNLTSMFQGATSFNQSLDSWDTSAVTKLAGTFNGASAFDGDISEWETGAVTTMAYTFQNATVFNQDISGWDTGNVTTMNRTFNVARGFNADIGSWDTAQVTDFYYTFANTNTFNQDISSWDTSSATDFSGMFQSAIAFNSPLDAWGAKTSDVASMYRMFYGATTFNQPLDSWDVGNVTSMEQMFFGATAFSQDLNSWRPGSVTTMAGMFHGATSFAGDIADWTVGDVTTFLSFAENASSFNSDIGGWDTSSATDMAKMFKGASVFNQDLRAWDMGGVTTADQMFTNAALGTANYNRMLYSWAYGFSSDGVTNGAGTGVVTDDVVFSAGAAKYSIGLPTDARAVLVARGWTITDGGSTNADVPLPPTNVTWAESGTTRTVQWDAPADRPSPATNPAIISYLVRAYSGVAPALTATDITCGSATTSCDVPGLDESGDYSFSVIAINDIGESDPSQMSAPATPAAPVAQSRFESAKVGWIPQPTTGGDPVTYEITASPDGATCTITMPERTCLVEGLTNGQAYTFTATATNALGTSAASDPSGSVTPGNAFVSTWRTNNAGPSSPRQIALPLTAAGSYNFTVMWGDGTTDTITSHNQAEATHTYATRGDYDVTITGNITGWRFANAGDRNKIVDISRWGPLRLGNAGNYFQGATRLRVSAEDALDLTGTTDLSYAFSGASRFNGAIGNWDTSAVTTMSNMFTSAVVFNQPLNDWDVSNVTDMSRMFTAAYLFDQPLNNWDVSSVTNFNQMFNSAITFDSSVSGWVPSSATNMSQMFYNAYAFNQPIDWTETGSVTNMSQMFYNADDFSQDLNSLDTSSVTNMSQMFYSTELFNGSISDWDTSAVTNMSQMFYAAEAFSNSDGIDDWDTGNVTTMQQMFRSSVFNQPIGPWDTGNVTDMSYMFQDNEEFDQPVGAWDTSKVTTMYRMFSDATSFDQDLHGWDTGNVTGTGMVDMFYGATAFDGRVDTWNTSKLTSLWNLFYGSNFNQDVSDWDTANVTDFRSVFRGTRFRGDVTDWNVAKATDMTHMFSSIRPTTGPKDKYGLRATPWLNKILIAWAAQPVKNNVRLDFSDTTGGGSYPKYTVGAFSLGSEAAYNYLTRATNATPDPGKGWTIYTGGTTTVNSPGTPTDVTVDRTGSENNGDEATITWKAPRDGDTAAPMAFEVRSTTDSSVGCDVSEAIYTPAEDPADDPVLSCIATDLNPPGQTVFHQFTVTAVNAVGDSDPSDPPLPVQLPGPLTPTLGTPTPTADGFTVQVTNFNPQYQWSGTATANGVVAVDDETGLATITGVAPDTNSVATIVASRFGYTDRSGTSTATSLRAALVPEFGATVRTADGFKAVITNYDAPDYEWQASVPGPGSAEIVAVGDDHELRVTGLNPNTPATATVTSTRVGYATGSAELTASSLLAALTPDFADTVGAPDGFTAVITNYDDTYTWDVSMVEGSPGSVGIVVDGDDHLVSVTDLDPEQEASVLVTASREDSVTGSNVVNGAALIAPRVPTLGDPTPTADGFTVPITNYDAAWTWEGDATAGGSVTVDGAEVTVSDVDPATEVTATIRSVRTGYATGSTPVTATSLMAALVPELAEPTRTADGFTALITNYDDGPSFTWQVERTSQRGTATIEEIEGVGHVVTVTGLPPADAATVVVTTTQAGYATGEFELTESSLSAKLVPTFGDPVPGDGEFTVAITNYDSEYDWSAETTAGTAEIVELTATTANVVVTSLAIGESAVVTISAVRTGYAPGDADVTGTSLRAGLSPTFGSVDRTANGFTVPISNYDGENYNPSDYEWAVQTTEGEAVIEELTSTTARVVVTNLADGQEATVTVTTSRTGYFDGDNTQAGAALDAALTPAFGPVTPGDGSWTAAITNYDGDDYDPSDYDWAAESSAGDVEVEVLSPTTAQVKVTGLNVSEIATVTVTTTRDGYRDGSGDVTGSSLRAALTPAFGSVDRVANGFTVPISNYDGEDYNPGDYEWAVQTTEGHVVIEELTATTARVVVTELTDGQEATVTVTTTRAGYFDGDNTQEGSALDAALTPGVDPAVSGDGQWRAAITNYDSDNYDWAVDTTAGDVAIDAINATTADIVVTNLDVGQEATVTINTSRSGYRNGSTEVTGAALAAALNPTFGAVTRTATGFTAPITNYNDDFDWTPTSTAGTVTVDETSPTEATVTVTELNTPGQRATVTVTTTRTGYFDGTSEVRGRSILGGLTPTFDPTVRDVHGFSAEITNYDPDYGWDATTTEGDVAIVADGDTHTVVVTNLTDGQPATVTVTTDTDPGPDTGTLGEATIDSAALGAKYQPETTTPEPGDGSWTAQISNYNPDYNWAADTTAGTATINTTDNPGLLTVTGLTVGQEATVTITTTRDGYRDGSSDVTGTALRAALTPAFGSVDRVANGFTVPISNYDGEDYNPGDYEWAVQTTEGEVVIEELTATTARVVVTELTDGQEATVTVTTTRAGYFDGDNTQEGSALDAALTPGVDPAVSGDGQWRAAITNYDSDNYDWAVDTTAGDVAIDATNATTADIVVTNLDVGQEATVTINTSRSGYRNGSTEVTGSSLRAALTPTFGSVTRTTTGFIAPITNYDGDDYNPADYNWAVETTAGSAAIEVLTPTTAQVVVTDLASGGERATATVTTTRDGYFEGEAEVSGRSDLAQLIPTFDPTVRDVHGFSAEITNYDPDYGWDATTTEGDVAIVADGDTHTVVVTNLTDGQPATVTVTTDTDPGPDTGTLGEATIDSAALGAKYQPETTTPEPGDGSWTAQISNYNPDYNWAADTTAGTATINTTDNPGLLTVTGLTVGQEATVTITTTRDGYRDGSSDVTGSSLRAALTPAFGSVDRVANGFTVPISNYDGEDYNPGDYEWAVQTTEGEVVIEELTATTARVVVTELTDGQEATVTVTTTRAGYFDGDNTQEGSALDAALTPGVDPAVSGDGQWRAAITNYDSDNYDWAVDTTAGDVAIDATNATTADIVVTNLDVGQEATVTINTSRSGYRNGSTEVTGAALAAALNPTFGAVTRTATGFTAPITNYNDDFDWTPTSTAGTVTVDETSPTEATVTVTELNTPGQRATVTVTTTRTGYFDGTSEVRGRSILGGLTPTFDPTVRDVHGFSAEITNYDPDYGWDATTTEGDVAIVADGDTHTVVVTNLTDGQPATVTVTTDTDPGPDTGTLGEATIDSAALGAKYQPETTTPEPGDGSWTAQISNYDPDYNWAADTTAGTATINTTDNPGLLTVTGLTVGQEATVTVTTTRDGYRDGSSDVTGTALRAALTPQFGPVTRTDGGFSTPITNYDGEDYNPADYDWTADTTDGTAEIDPTSPTTARLVVTGLADGQEATASVTTTRTGYFDGDNTVNGTALETELIPAFGEPVAGSRSFTAQITNYDPQFTWTAESDRGTAVVDEEADPVVVRVSGLDPLQEATVEVTTSRDGYNSGTASVQGAADIGGRLDPEFGTAVPTSDGFTAPITNFDAAFTFTAVSTQGQARVSGAGQVVVTGVAPDTDVSVTVTSTRNRYDSGTGTTQSRSLKAALEPELQNGTRLAGGYSTEVTRYSSRYAWIVSTGVGSATINDRGEIKVSGLNPGQATTLTVRTTRDGYGEGRTTVEARALEAALTPALSAITRTPTGFQAQITNFDGAFTWSATAAAGSVSVSGSGLVTVTGLPAGAGSQATVTASRTGYETGSSSITGQALTVAPSASVPAAPTIKSIKAKKRGKAKIAWLATGTARPPITSAVATCKAGKSKASVTGTTSTLTIKGLRKGKKYSCTVQVKNISGTSAKSAPVKIKAK